MYCVEVNGVGSCLAVVAGDVVFSQHAKGPSMPKVGRLSTSLILLLTLILANGSVAGAAKKKAKDFEPGKARWEIKTTIPDDASVKNSTKVALKTMLAIKPPAGAKGHSRRMDHKRYASTNAAGLVEGDMITVSGWIRLIAAEPDGDYHIQIAQTKSSQARCFIVEVPRPLNTFVKEKRVLKAAATVRAKIRSNVLGGKELRYGGVKLLKSPKQRPVYATFTGQFFYDDWHIGDAPRGKKGCKSPTIAEIHPIMAVQFPAPPR
jgi:hypothetical protein